MKKRILVSAIALLIISTALFVLLSLGSNINRSISRSAQAAGADMITPTITAIDPSSAFNDLDASVVITGNDFTIELSGTLVLTSPTAYLGGTALQDVTWVSSTTLTAIVPWGMNSGTYALTVVNPGGGIGGLSNAFTVVDGIGHWNGGDLFGGDVRQVLLKPGNPNTIYALGYDVGLFRSRDAGETWRFISGEVIGNADFVTDPHRPSRLYSARWYGLCRSEDEGDSWEVMLGEWPDGRAVGDGQVHISPHSANILFFSSAYDGAHSYAQALGLARSADDGGSWTIVAEMEGVSVRTVAFHPNNPLEMVLGTDDGRVFRSIDAGNHWNQIAKPPIDDVRFITYNPYDLNGEVWVVGSLIDGTAGVVKSLDNTLVGWINVAPNNYTHATTIDFSSATSVYFGIYHSNDGGLSWHPFGPLKRGYDIAFDQSNLDIMHVCDRQYGIQKTTDGGQTWAVKNQGLSAMAASDIEASPEYSTRVVYAVFVDWDGVFRSSDGATSWQFIPVEGAGNVRQVRVDPFDSQRVYLAADSGFYTSNDGGATWILNAGFCYSGMPYAFQPDPHQSGHLLVGLYGSPGALCVSTDYGNTWEYVAVAPDLKPVRDIGFDPLHPGVVYLASDGSGAYRSSDNGYTWQRVGSEYEAMQKSFSVAIATHPQHMVIVGGNHASYRSLDGGDTWAQIGCSVGGNTDSFLFVDRDSTRFYAATWDGLFLSVDGGKTCKPASGVLGRLHSKALAYSGSGGSTILYVATTGGDPGIESDSVFHTASTSDDAEEKLPGTDTDLLDWHVFLPLVLHEIPPDPPNNLVEAGVYRFVERQ